MQHKTLFTYSTVTKFVKGKLPQQIYRKKLLECQIWLAYYRTICVSSLYTVV